MLNCKRATELLSQGLDRPLGIGERAQLLLHLHICRTCNHFGRELTIVRQATKQLLNHPQDGGAIDTRQTDSDHDAD